MNILFATFIEIWSRGPEYVSFVALVLVNYNRNVYKCSSNLCQALFYPGSFLAFDIICACYDICRICGSLTWLTSNITDVYFIIIRNSFNLCQIPPTEYKYDTHKKLVLVSYISWVVSRALGKLLLNQSKWYYPLEMKGALSTEEQLFRNSSYKKQSNFLPVPPLLKFWSCYANSLFLKKRYQEVRE